MYEWSASVFVSDSASARLRFIRRALPTRNQIDQSNALDLDPLWWTLQGRKSGVFSASLPILVSFRVRPLFLFLFYFFSPLPSPLVLSVPVFPAPQAMKQRTSPQGQSLGQPLSFQGLGQGPPGRFASRDSTLSVFGAGRLKEPKRWLNEGSQVVGWLSWPGSSTVTVTMFCHCLVSPSPVRSGPGRTGRLTFNDESEISGRKRKEPRWNKISWLRVKIDLGKLGTS